MSSFDERKKLYKKIEKARGSKVLAFVTSDRPLMETQIAPDCIPLFVDFLDGIGPTSKISLLLHTNGGNTLAAWRLVNLIRMYCDKLEVIVPSKALSAGTLIALGAECLVMTKQAALGPIDPSVSHPLGPTFVHNNQVQRVPVSVEAVRGYLDQAMSTLQIKDDASLGALLVELSKQIHPLVLGEIFRSREQIRQLAKKLVTRHITDEDKVQGIVDFLCADSGSHDYTINRREAEQLGLNTEKPSEGLYQHLRAVDRSWTSELKVLEPLIPESMLGEAQALQYRHTRGLIEATEGGSFQFLSEGEYFRETQGTPHGPMQVISERRTFEGWKKL